MRSPYRIATTAVALAAAFPISVGTASAADSLTETPAASAYFSSTTPQKNDAYPADPGPYFNQAGADGVAPGNLAVAVVAPNMTDKESFLRFDLLSVPQGATVDSAVVTVLLQADTDKDKNVSPDPAKVKACAAGPQGFADGIDAGGYDERPSTNCDKLNVVAKASVDGKAYTFDVTPLAKTWLTEINDGIALVPATTAQPFQVVFQKGTLATIAVTYTVADVVVDPVPTTNPQPPVFPGVVAPPVDNSGTGVSPNVQPLPQPTPAPTAAPSPVVQQTRQPVTPAAGGGFAESNGLSGAFWLAALAGVGLIGAISLVLGSPEVPVRSGSVQNGVGRALDQRRRVGSRAGLRPTARPVLPA